MVQEYRVRWWESQEERERVGIEMAADYRARNGATYPFYPADELTCLKRCSKARKSLNSALKRAGFTLNRTEPSGDGGEWLVYSKEA